MAKLGIFMILAFVAVSQAFMPGGGEVMTPAEIKNDKILQNTILPEVADTYNTMSNNIYAYKAGNLVKATKRVVAGLEYDIILMLNPTECKKNMDKYLKKDLEHCQLSAQDKVETCSFNIWFRPWMVLGAPAPVKVTFKGCK